MFHLIFPLRGEILVTFRVEGSFWCYYNFQYFKLKKPNIPETLFMDDFTPYFLCDPGGTLPIGNIGSCLWVAPILRPEKKNCIYI